MENEDSAATRAQARANLSNARAMLLQTPVPRDHFAKEDDRYKNLIARGYISPSEYDAANTRYRRAQEAVKAAEAAVRAEVHVDYALIRAPFDGVVLTKNADVGDIVTPLSASSVSKAAVVTLADMKSLQVEVDVSETSITLIQVGQPCDIHLDAIPDRRFRGAVHAIVPTVDRAKATVLVKVKFLDHDPRMLPDMSAKVSFLSRPLAGDEMKPRLAVHQSALESNRQESVVYRISGSTVRKTVVTTAGRLGDMVEVTAGLTAGDRVVLKPEGLKDGAKIKVAER
jgi:RND family efflux transporter MFP subunit